MLVDAEIEQVRKAGTATDNDSDGVLDWSELRRAVIKLSTKLVRARRRPNRATDSSRQHLVTCSVRGWRSRCYPCIAGVQAQL